MKSISLTRYLSIISLFLFLSCNNDDDIKPISLRDSDETTFTMYYPNYGGYSFPLTGGDGSYRVQSADPTIIKAEMISDADISLEALALGQTTVTITDYSQNTLILHITVDYNSDRFKIVKHDITIMGGDLTENERNEIRERYLPSIPIKVGGGYKFIYTETDGADGRGKAIIYPDSYGSNGIETIFEREWKSGIVESMQIYTVVLNNETRAFVFQRYYPSSKATENSPVALVEDITKKVQEEYPQAELVFTSQVIDVPKE